MDNQASSLEQITSTPMPTARKPKDWFKILQIVIGFLIVLGLFGNIYLLLRKEKQKPISQITPTPTQTALLLTPTPDLTANWKTYSSSRLKYSFKYPSEWTFYPYKENDPQVAFGAHTLLNYSGSEIEKYMSHGIVDWKKFLGEKPAIKIDFFVYSKETHQIDDVRKYAQEILLKSAVKMLGSNLQIDNLETIRYKATEDLGPTDVKEINQYFAFPDENKIVFISLYFWNIPDFEHLQSTAEWQILVSVLSNFSFNYSFD